MKTDGKWKLNTLCLLSTRNKMYQQFIFQLIVIYLQKATFLSLKWLLHFVSCLELSVVFLPLLICTVLLDPLVIWICVCPMYIFFFFFRSMNSSLFNQQVYTYYFFLGNIYAVAATNLFLRSLKVCFPAILWCSVKLSSQIFFLFILMFKFLNFLSIM